MRDPGRQNALNHTNLVRRTLIVTSVCASALLTNDLTAAPANRLPSQQEVLTLIVSTIDWYRHLPNIQQIGTEPGNLLFLENNRSITAEVVRLSFDFGKALAAAETVENPSESPSPPELAANSELQDLIADRKKLNAATQKAMIQLGSLTRAEVTVHGLDGTKLDTQVAEIQSRIQLLQAMSAQYQYMLGFIRTANADADRATSMAALVENLERTVPDVFAAASSQTSNIPADPSRAPSGIKAMMSQVSALARKERLIDETIARTDALSQSLQNMRTPFREPFQKQFSTLTLDDPGLDLLQRQESRLSQLIAQAKTVSPAIGALMRQQTLLRLYRTHLTEWRTEVRNESRTAWKAVLLRIAAAGGSIAILLAISAIVRRLAHRHVHHADTLQTLLIGERVLFWIIIAALVLFAFALDLNSLATFFGLLFAGTAVGLHDVFLSIGGYLLMVRKFHIRPGDRVQISGVAGEVTNLGLLQFELSEIDRATGERTGRVVFLSNSYVFVSPATPLFRQVSAPT